VGALQVPINGFTKILTHSLHRLRLSKLRVHGRGYAQSGRGMAISLTPSTLRAHVELTEMLWWRGGRLVGRLGPVDCLLRRVALKEGSGNGWNQLLAAGQPVSWPAMPAGRSRVDSLSRAGLACCYQTSWPAGPGPKGALRVQVRTAEW